MTRQSIIVLIALVALVGRMLGQEAPQVIDGFVARTSAVGMPYRLFVPKGYDKMKQYPLLVWFHGAGGRGADNLQQISGDQVAGTRLFASDKTQSKYSAFVVAPQSVRAWQQPMGGVDLQPEPQAVLEIIDALIAEYSIDQRRVYLVGQSNGAGGAWNLVTNRPDRFAAVLFVCPAGLVWSGVARASAAARVPFWAIEGALDSGPYLQNVIEAIKQSGGHPKFTVYPDAGHEIWDRAFAEPDIAEWIFAQSK
jgi:predicted peptidase